MTQEAETQDPVQVEVTLTIDGDWNADPLKLLSGLGKGSRSLERWQRKAVAAARERGLTWDAIGSACGISRQAAWERFSTDRERGDSSE
jgi:hypothetical protein